MTYKDMVGWCNYSKLSSLKHLYLEDSYVLEIVSTKEAIEFQIDFVLTHDHPSYRSPEPNEQYCYRKGKLKFANIRILNEFVQTSVQSVDSTGESDLGNIDSFVCLNHRYVLEGEWGKLDIESDEPEVTYI